MPAATATTEELEMIKSYIIVPMILTAFERDLKVIEQSMKNPGPYQDVIKGAMDRASLLLYEIRREFRKRGIKVFDTRQDNLGVRADYKCRGYEGTLYMLRSLIRAEANVRMRAYMGLDVSNMQRSAD
ncbi:hypothetical protein PAV_109p00240 (plasmid) [Paenibacillus alvei DSM 29]|nr:hypothetical protein PAV_109p00240 [Paenibacillus alvei DSM 29]